MFSEALNVFVVGGCLRDQALIDFGAINQATSIKDIDFAVEAESIDVMTEELTALGFEIFKSDPEFVTLRARFPHSIGWAEWLLDQDFNLGLTADFVLCRKDGEYKDGRRPESVSAGTIFDDLARRDFTVNAIARHAEAGILDPFDGMGDCSDRILRFVGDPLRRIQEDGLRVLRGLRFMVTRGLTPTADTEEVLHSAMARNAVAQQNDQRIFEEVEKMFRFDTPKAILILNMFHMMPVVFPEDGNMWLRPTMKERQGV